MHLVLALLPGALAGPVDEALATAREALVAQDREATEAALEQAEQALADPLGLVMPVPLGSIWFYRGVIELQADPDGELHQPYWEQALVMNVEYPLDKELLKTTAQRDFFEALRGQALELPQNASGVADFGDDRVYIDGRLISSYDLLATGTHYVQVLCADDRLISGLYAYGSAPAFDTVCTAGAIPESALTLPKPPKALVVAIAPAPEAVPVLVPETPVENPVEPATSRLSEVDRGKVATVGLFATGGAMLLAGAGANFLVVEPIYADIESARADPRSLNRTRADDLSSTFNRARGVTIGLLGAGTLAVAGGVVTWRTVSVSATPTGVQFTGSF